MRLSHPRFRLIAAAAALAAAMAAPAQDKAVQDEKPQCALPDTPAIPDGSRSSEQRMQEAREAVTGYLEANAAYRECLAAGLKKDEQGKPANPRLHSLIDEMIGEAYDTAELVADTFNHNLRKFEQANQ